MYMKKNLILVAMASMMMASCVQEESLENQDVLSSAPKEITFQAVVAKQSSRALIDGPEYKPTDPSFGVWARYNPDNENVGFQSFINNEKVVYHPEPLPSSGYWSIDYANDEDIKYWPGVGSLTFFAYSPFYYQEDPEGETKVVDNSTASSPQVGSYGIVFPNYNVKDHQQTDLMVADVVKGLRSNIPAGTQGNASAYTGVPTVFRHKLALIDEFVLKTSDDYDGKYAGDNKDAVTGNMRFFVEKIELIDLDMCGTYYGETYKLDGTKVEDKWELPTEAARIKESYVWFDAEEAYDEHTSTPNDGEGQNNGAHSANVSFDSYIDKNDVTHYGVEFGHSDTKTLNIKKLVTGAEYNRNPTIANGYLLVLPQTFTAGQQKLRVTYYIKTFESGQENDGTESQSNGMWGAPLESITRTYDLAAIHSSNLQWPMNAKIKYTLMFSTQEIRWAPYVGAWESTDYTVDI